MTKEQIFAVVKKHILQTVDGLNDSDIPLGESMKNLGANVSSLAKVSDMGGLVGLLHAVSLEARPA